MSDEIDLANKVKQGLNDVLIPPWQGTGLSANEYTENLKNKLEALNEKLKSGQGDSSLVKSTLTDALQFFSYSLIAKEVHGAKNMIDAHINMAKEKANDTSSKTRFVTGE